MGTAITQASKDFNVYFANQPAAAVRRLLWHFTWLAWVLDGKPRMRRYAANIMIFVPWEDANSTQLALRRFSDHADSEMLGLLVLDPEFSVTLAMPAKRDNEIEGFALPVPREVHRAGKVRVLPGAPRAFLERAPDWYADSSTMVEYCRQTTSFNEGVIAELEVYLSSEPGRLVRSFLSLPILRPGEDAPCAVLNLHADENGVVAQDMEVLASTTDALQEFIAAALAAAQKRRQAEAHDAKVPESS